MATPEMVIYLLGSLFSTAWSHDALHPAQLVDNDRLAINISTDNVGYQAGDVLPRWLVAHVFDLL
jgi:hypothetical protein